MNTPNTTSAIVAGRLLALSLTDDPAINTHVVRQAAELAATQGVEAASGFVEGVWYVTGNRRTESFPFGANETWKRARLAIGSAS
jgi:hypothetical protein